MTVTVMTVGPPRVPVVREVILNFSEFFRGRYKHSDSGMPTTS